MEAILEHSQCSFRTSELNYLQIEGGEMDTIFLSPFLFSLSLKLPAVYQKIFQRFMAKQMLLLLVPNSQQKLCICMASKICSGNVCWDYI